MAKAKPIDVDELLMALRTGAVGSNYTETDCYREFRQVFLGSEAGKRVLWQILSAASLFGKSFDADPHIHAFNAGARDIALEIVRRTYVEPIAKPTKQTTRREE